MTGWALAGALGLMALNAFFVAFEFALVTSRHERLERWAADGRRPAQAALRARAELPLQLAGAQLGVTMASLALGFVAEPAVGHLLESALGPLGLPDGVERGLALAVALGLVTFLHLVLGEMVPKNVALAGPERVLVVLVYPDRVYVSCFRPVIRALNALANAGVRLCGVEPRSELASAHTAEELALMVTASRREGLIEPFEHELLAGALDFGNRAVSSVMVARDRIVATSPTAPVADVEDLVARSGHSRLPVAGRDLDDVVGVVHAKDLLRFGGPERAEPLPAESLRPVLVVDAAATLADVLARMQQARRHLALVADPTGRTVGLVTLEDVLEAIVGDIRDESDPRGAGPPDGRRRSPRGRPAPADGQDR